MAAHPGPLSSGNARRRNAPTIPTTVLPAAGREGRPPRPPASYSLGKAAKSWWNWAWKLPQACAWSDGDLYVVARRASLEDDLSALALVDHFDLAEFLGIEEADEQVHAVERVIRTLKASAAGRLAVMKEIRELDDRLGLTPSGLARMRWTIIDTPTPIDGDGTSGGTGRRRHLQAVDPTTAQTA